MKKALRTLAILSFALVAMLSTQSPVSAATSKGEAQYQQWLDQVAVTTSVDGVITNYTERQVGQPAFQAMKHQQFLGTVSTQTVWWNCPAGVGCVWVEANGGGDKFVMPISTYGGGGCFGIPIPEYASVSSASADYGNGYDLKLWMTYLPCLGGSWFVLQSSHSVNFTGVLATWNDSAMEAQIGQY